MNKKGHYESQGYIWEEGEEPKCSYCGELATRSTGVSGVHICDEIECGMLFLMEESNPIEFIEA